MAGEEPSVRSATLEALWLEGPSKRIGANPVLAASDVLPPASEF